MTERKKMEGPSTYDAEWAARHAVTRVGVLFACEAAAQGYEVVYASDWSPGGKNEDSLRAAGVEVVHTRERRP